MGNRAILNIRLFFNVYWLNRVWPWLLSHTIVIQFCPEQPMHTKKKHSIDCIHASSSLGCRMLAIFNHTTLHWGEKSSLVASVNKISQFLSANSRDGRVYMLISFSHVYILYCAIQNAYFYSFGRGLRLFVRLFIYQIVCYLLLRW